MPAACLCLRPVTTWLGRESWWVLDVVGQCGFINAYNVYDVHVVDANYRIPNRLLWTSELKICQRHVLPRRLFGRLFGCRHRTC